jgi:tRNA-dihydrouridine synthase A
MIANALNHRLCIAPMMTHTDRHFRYFLRLISRRVMLYTEMITTGAIIHGKQYQRLEFSEEEHPLALQLGGNDPVDLSECARIAEQYGYDEINLNIGCPSDRVRNGRFGACLMAYPEVVADCVSAMQAGIAIPVTVKTRIGIDDQDSYEHLAGFIDTVAKSGCRTFIIHARKAWLQGLSPRQNREVPPLRFETVYRIKSDFPELEIIINGGVTTLDQAQAHLQQVDGVMIGRAICNNPYMLAEADRLIFNQDTPPVSRSDILKHYLDYTETHLAKGTSLQETTRHILGLFQGQPGARKWRRYLSENIYHEDSGIEVIENALAAIRAA